MSDNKKYYYLKLKDDFFDTEEMKILESMDNGYKYSNILLKMYLKSLKKEGLLMFKNSIPYNPKMIATITDHNINDVKQALQLFQQLDLIEVLSNGAIYMMDIQNFIGTSSTEADRVRAYRNEIKKKKQELLNKAEGEVDPQIFIDGKTADVTNVQQMYNKCTPEKELELELELENKDKDNKPSEKSDTESDKFSLTKKDNGRYDYPEEYERLYSLYPYQRGNKKAGWRKWAATRRKKVDQKDLVEAVKGYAAQCKKDGTEEKWVMHIKTFLGPDEHWKEYLGGNESGEEFSIDNQSEEEKLGAEVDDLFNRD